jgi:hypothetical protein
VAGSGQRGVASAGASGGKDPLAGYEVVEFEEIDETGRAATAPTPVTRPHPAHEHADRTEDHAMSQPEETRPRAVEQPDRSMVPPPGPAPRGRGGSGFLAGLLGGLLGSAALIGGGGWYAYEHGPLKPAMSRLTATESAIQGTEAGIAGLGEQLGQIRGELTALRGAMESTSSTIAALDQRVTAVDQRVGATDQRVAAVERSSRDVAANVEQASTSFRKAGEEVIGRLEAVNAKLVEVERAQPADVVDKGTVETIAGKQAGIEQAQGRLEAGLARLEQLVAQGLEAGNQQGAALRMVADTNRTKLDDVASQVRGLEALNGQVAQHEAAHAEHRAAIEETGTKIAAVRSDVEQQLQQVTGRLTALDKQRERGVGMSLAVDSLETALQSGQPFKPTLEILSQLGQGDAVVEGVMGKLQPVAESGVPTVAELAKRIGDVERTLTPQQEGQAQDWLERTRQNLEGLVDLHPAGEEDVPGRNAVQGATQAILLQDLEGAVQAMEPLAQQGNAQAQAWVQAARARLEARGAVETLRQHVKTLLARQD